MATLPENCFDLVAELDQAFRDGQVKTSVSKEVLTSGVFQGVVGYRDQVKLYDILVQLIDGEISLAELRQLGKQLKVNIIALLLYLLNLGIRKNYEYFYQWLRMKLP